MAIASEWAQRGRRERTKSVRRVRSGFVVVVVVVVVVGVVFVGGRTGTSRTWQMRTMNGTKGA